jgi:hypothetical protein
MPGDDRAPPRSKSARERRAAVRCAHDLRSRWRPAKGLRFEALAEVASSPTGLGPGVASDAFECWMGQTRCAVTRQFQAAVEDAGSPRPAEAAVAP